MHKLFEAYYNKPIVKKEIQERWQVVKPNISEEDAILCEFKALDELSGKNIGELDKFLKTI